MVDCPEALHQFIDHVGELGGIVTVARVGMADERDAAVDRYHEPETDQSEVTSLLLGFAPLCDGRSIIGRIDVGGEVGHVEHQARNIHRELFDHAGHDAAFDLDQMLVCDRIHGVPEPTVVQCRHRRTLQEAVTGRGRPPVAEGQLRARGDHPVQGGQCDVGPHRQRGVGAS